MDNKKALILVAEDDPFLAEVYTRKLSKADFEVFVAPDGAVALDFAKKRKPDIILLDLIMPIMDGFETLRSLKADATLKDVKVIILSNISQEEDKKKTMDMGAFDYIVKSNVDFSEIIELIRKNLK